MLLSPGIEIKEKDLSVVVANSSMISSAFAGQFNKGPVEEATLITNVGQLISTFGEPSKNNLNDWYQAYNYLRYSNALYVSRALDTNGDAMNSTNECEAEGGDAVVAGDVSAYLVTNGDSYEAQELSIGFADSTNTKLKFIAKSAGDFGNKIKVAIANRADFIAGTAVVTGGSSVGEFFENIPAADEFAVIVFEDDAMVESFIVSKDEDAKDHVNKSTYCEKVINRKSSYIYVKDNTALDVLPASKLGSDIIALSQGSNGATNAGDVQVAYDVFANPEEIQFTGIIGNELCNKYVADMAAARKDCVAYIGIDYASVVGLKSTDSVANIVDVRTSGAMNVNTSFASLYGNYAKQYCKYTDTEFWCNVAGHMSGLSAMISETRDPWFAPAGDKTQMQGVIKLAFNPSKAERDIMYKNQINPVVSFPGQGIMPYGQKTLTSVSSAFDRINVRKLFNYCETNISKSTKAFVFEMNDVYTQNALKSMIDAFLKDIKARRGLYDYAVVCDSSNNTPQVVDTNRLVCDVFLKPTRAAEFITLNFVAVATGTDFSEIMA